MADPAPPGLATDVDGLVRGRLEIVRSGIELHVQGVVQATVIVACSRCLEVCREEVVIEVDEECTFGQIDDPAAYNDEFGRLPLLNGDELDLSELVRQLITIHTPPRVICDEDCAGLCAMCGQDLNKGPCRCNKPEDDPRWQGLRGLQ